MGTQLIYSINKIKRLGEFFQIETIHILYLQTY